MERELNSLIAYLEKEMKALLVLRIENKEDKSKSVASSMYISGEIYMLENVLRMLKDVGK